MASAGRRLVVFDIDGVLADCSHRLHFQQEKDYDSFYSAEEMLKDTVIEQGVNLLYDLVEFDDKCDIVFLTGRPERTRLTTDTWMKAHYINFLNNHLIMRKDGDHRPSDVVKLENLNWYLSENDSYDDIYYIDDDPKNTKALESIENLTALTFGTKRFKL